MGFASRLRMRHLSNDRLLSELKDLVRKERELLNQLLRHLAEVERRGLHLDRAYPSLFEFCTRYLGYSGAEAYARIQAMRLMKAVPGTEEMLKKGSLSLTNASFVQSRFQQEDRRRKKLQLPALNKSEKLEMIAKIENSSIRECTRKVHELLPELQPIPKEKTIPLANGRYLIQFVADEVLMKAIDEAKAVFSHSNTHRYDQLISFLLRHAFKKLHPLRSDAPFLRSIKGTVRH